MDKRYFFRGLGIGLVIGGLVMFAALGTDKLSTADRKSVATPTDVTEEKNNSEETATEKITTEKATTETATEKTTTEKTATEKTTTEKTATEKTTTEKATTEKTTTEKATEEKTTEEVTTEKATEELKPEAVKNESGVGGYITIVSGMNALDICEELETIGVISDKWDYYDWLLQSGYSESLMQGTYYFTGYESYAGIVWILLGNQ